MSRGRIEKALSGFYYVNTGAEVLQCRARGRFRKEGIAPLVGDWVEVRELGGGEGFLESVEERRNVFTRPSAANIDQLVMIASGAIPVTDPYLIDRIAAIATLKKCQVLLVLNKCDLDRAEELYDLYCQSAVPVLRVSAETGEGMEELRRQISGKLNVFTGNSGVGKSSILNQLVPGLDLPVGDVSKALGRGRHTTRHVEMFALGEGTYVIDTPGFSSFDTEDLNLELKAQLPQTFPEFRPYLDECRFVGCHHVKEKGCAVLQALKEGKIPAGRHASYVRLWNEVKDLQEWSR
ncbi:MAG: ribosome small subunit-dependent GTPase A [Ruminococcaceae bacterium]|nr:ribosome small subunit-dependent GTPase A [Oscillospiraceae bacterium]